MTMTRRLLFVAARQSIRCRQSVPGCAFHHARSLSALRSFSSNSNFNKDTFVTTEHNEAPSTAQPQGVSQISDPIPAGTESGNIHEDEYGDDEEVTDVDGYRPDSEPFKNKVNVRMPDMGDSDGVIVKWHKQEGDILKYEDPICDVKTEAFTFGMTCEDEHETIMGKILVAEGEKVPDGAVIYETWHPAEKELKSSISDGVNK